MARARAKAKAQLPRVSWQSPLEQPSLQAVPSQPTPAPLALRAPTPSPITPDDTINNRDVITPIPSSPPVLILSSPSPDRTYTTTPAPQDTLPPSSPVQLLDYKVGIQYTLFVNGSRKNRHTDLDKIKLSISMSDIKDVVKSIIASLLSIVNRQTYTYISCLFLFRTD